MDSTASVASPALVFLHRGPRIKMTSQGRQLTLQKINGKPGQVYYPLHLSWVPRPKPGPNQILVAITASSLNHRDLFIRKHLYPAISFTTPLLADGVGLVCGIGPSAPDIIGRTVLLPPSLNWASAPEGPEDLGKFAIAGASKLTPLGYAADYVTVDAAEVEFAPGHLSGVEAAALPLVGTTAWRALVTKSGNAKAGRNILVTGIGGGVAIMVLQLAVAMGCNVFVTSSSEEKIAKAVNLGAKGGVNYKHETWAADLQRLLPEDRPWIDAVIDRAGGAIVGAVIKFIKVGGVIVSYGMTQGPKMDWLMQAVLKNIELRGSTMGSRKEFAAMVNFVTDKKITPVVSRSLTGLDNIDAIDGLFEDMEAGKQFGKLVIEHGQVADIQEKL